jgi:hypothetical protein
MGGVRRDRNPCDLGLRVVVSPYRTSDGPYEPFGRGTCDLTRFVTKPECHADIGRIHLASAGFGTVLSEHLRRHYGVHLGVRQCQRLFRRMGFRLRKPRPQVAQADPLKIAAVKKTPPPGPARRR